MFLILRKRWLNFHLDVKGKFLEWNNHSLEQPPWGGGRVPTSGGFKNVMGGWIGKKSFSHESLNPTIFQGPPRTSNLSCFRLLGIIPANFTTNLTCSPLSQQPPSEWRAYGSRSLNYSLSLYYSLQKTKKHETSRKIRESPERFVSFLAISCGFLKDINKWGGISPFRCKGYV